MVILIFILGLIIGSFLNCLVWRLHVGKTLGGRSQCTRCHKKIFWYDNIPVISFLVLKGRCRHCKKKISWQYPLVELATIPAAIFAFIANILLGMDWKSLIFGGIIGGGIFLAQFLLSRGKWIGGGDIRLGAVMGLMLGWQMVLLALFLSYTIGAAISIILVALKYKKFSSKVPFGAFLSSATILVLLYGDKLLGWYLRWL